MITALQLASALVGNDNEKDCHFCDKEQWGSEFHDPSCPFAMAYAIVKDDESARSEAMKV